MEQGNQLTAAAVRAAFAGAADFQERHIAPQGRRGFVFFLDGLTAAASIADFLLHPAVQALHGSAADMVEQCLEGAVWAAVAQPAGDLAAATDYLLSGFAVLLFEGCGRAVAFEMKSGDKRAVAPPSVEHTVKGAKDAFTEVLRVNTTLLRRHLRSEKLQLREVIVGKTSRTRVAVVWLQGAADETVAEQMLRRLTTVETDSFITPAAVEEAVSGARWSAFPLLRFTERADRFAQAMAAGKVGLLVDGLPLGYLAPVALGDFLASPEDEGVDFVTASCIRVLRYAAALLSLILPALYAAMATFHQEMIPTKLLHAIIESKAQVPFPTALEVLGLLIAFEILQEAGVHLPQSLGQAVSIIGGLVVGSAAVEARLISPAALIVVAVAGVAGYVIPGRELANALRVWRFLLAGAACAAGLFGLSVAFLALLLHLGGLNTFGLGYLRPFDRGTTGGSILRRRTVLPPHTSQGGPA